MPLKVYYLTFKGQFYIPNSLPKKRNFHSPREILHIRSVRQNLTIHAQQELIVIFRLFQAVFYKLHCFKRIHIGKVSA